jgi:hypothetical protein
VLLHPWRLVGQPEPLPLAAVGPGNRFTAQVAPPAVAELWSLSLEVRDLRRGSGASRLELGGETLPLFLNRSRGRWRLYLTPRFQAPAGATRVDLGLPGFASLPEPPRVELARWLPPG